MRLVLILLSFAVMVSTASAKLSKVEIESREIILNGKSFGGTGAYEKLRGIMHFSYDPSNPYNKKIVDIDIAERGPDGLVHANANFTILQPVDADKRRGIAFVELVNRGDQHTLKYLNRAVSNQNNPVTEEDFGDGLMMEEGLTLIFIGWQYDIPKDNGQYALNLPVAKGIEGLVRSDWMLDEPTDKIGLGHRGIPAHYKPIDPESYENILYERDGRATPRRIVPHDKWEFVDGNAYIHMPGGFKTDRIYELVYKSKDPVISGISLAITRDIASYAKYNKDSEFPVDKAISFGVSQTGRYLRHFTYYDFNTDEDGKKAFDGMYLHTSGAGRGSFNHRFSQPSRDAQPYTAFFYPTDLFPFSVAQQSNPKTGEMQGFFDHANPDHLPKMIYTATGYEYWGRAVSLLHTTVDGAADIPLHENERIYHLAGGQHYVGEVTKFEAKEPHIENQYRDNPIQYYYNLRAVMLHLVNWVDTGKEPPESKIPTIKDNTLVSIDDVNFPDIPGFVRPERLHTAYMADYGPRWDQGIVDFQPPRLLGEIIPKVPQVNEIGNSISGVQNVELTVPLGTYTAWQLRTGRHDPKEFLNFQGTFIPFSKTGDANDPRPSLNELYSSKDDYLNKVRSASQNLVSEGFLLERDIKYIVERSESYWDWVQNWNY